MKISPTINSISIAVWLIATISRTSSPCLFAAAFEGFVVDEELNPLTEAVRSVNRDAYKLVKLETLNYDRDALMVREAERRRLEKDFASSMAIPEEPDHPHNTNPQGHRKLWHTDPVAPYPVCSSAQVPESFLTARRRLTGDEYYEADSMDSFASSLLFEELQEEEESLEDAPSTTEEEEDASISISSIESSSMHTVDNFASVRAEQHQESRSLQTTTCANPSWKYNSCCGACGPSFSTWADLHKAAQDWANGLTSLLGNINCWDVSGVTSMWGMFNCSPDWCNVGFSKFNSNITCWDVSNVQDFSNMFYKAASFNQDISRWRVSSATTMKDMFNMAYSFNQNLCNWYCSLPTAIVKNDVLTSGIFRLTQCTRSTGSYGINTNNDAFCQDCAAKGKTFSCPPVPKPTPVVKPAPTKPAPVVKPAPTTLISPVKPAPTKPAPVEKPAPVKPAPTKPAPKAAVPLSASASLAIVGYYRSAQWGACYGELRFVSWGWTGTGLRQAYISYQQGILPTSSGFFVPSTNRGTIYFPGNIVGFTFVPSTSEIQWDVGGGFVQRDFIDCGDTTRLFDGSTDKWRFLGSTAAVELLMCDHLKGLPGFRIYAADTYPELDPNKYWLRGYKYSTNSWVTIHEGNFALSSARNTPGMDLYNPNANYYEVRYTCDVITCDIYDKYVLGLQRLNAPALQVGEIVMLQQVAMTPTKKPTKPPTMKPTKAPTVKPTKSPTKIPTSSPTITPKLTCPAPTSAPQVCDNGLVPGDIVVTAFNTDTGSGAQTVVLLTSSQKLNKGDTFYMTDRPLNCDANCNCDFLPLDQTYMDGTVMFTAPEPILAGKSIAYSQYKKPFAAKDVYFAWGKGQSCYYADAWSQVTWSSQSSTSQFHLYSYKREDDLTPYDILSGDNIFLYCMGNGKPVILFGLMLSDEINVEQGWTPYNRNLHSDFHNIVNATYKVASKKSHKPPNAPTVLLSPNTIPPPIGVQCTCTPPPNPTFLGCFRDSSNRALPVYLGQMNKDDCINACKSNGYHFAGRQSSSECWCGNSNSDGLADYQENDYAKYGPSTACQCDASNIGPWVNCVYKVPPTTPEYINNHFQCDDGYKGWCQANYDCLSSFNEGSWEDGCGIKGIAKKWEYRNNWRVKVPPSTDCQVVTPQDLVMWVTQTLHWNYTKNDYDIPVISSQVVTKGFNFLCEPPPDKQDAVVIETVQATAVSVHQEEMEMFVAQKNLEKATAILKVVEVKAAIDKCKENKSMYMPDGVTPIPGNESPNTQVTDPRLPKCFGKGPLCLEPGMVSSRQVQQQSATQDQELSLLKFGAGKVLSTTSSGATGTSSTQSNLGTF